MSMHDADRAHEHPERARDVSDHVMLKGRKCRRDSPALVDVGRRSGAAGHDRIQIGTMPRDVGARLLDRDAGLEASRRPAAEARQRDAAAIERRTAR